MSLRFGECGQSRALPDYRLRKEGRANLFAIIPCQVRALVVWTDGHRKQLHLGIEQLVRALQCFLPIVTSSSTAGFSTMLTAPPIATWKESLLKAEGVGSIAQPLKKD
jgi:hypothetical protein